MTNADSFRFKSNKINNGDTLNLCIEGLAKPEEYVNKNCRIEIFEVDNPQAKSDVIAIFEGKVGEDRSVRPHKYYFTYVQRTDSFPKTLTGPETRINSDTEGNSWIYGFKPTWLLPHFKLTFELSLGESPEQIIILSESELDREKYIFEIGFKVYIGTTLKYQYMTRRSYCTLDARRTLADNCKIASELLMADHIDMVRQRGIGTHYGSQYYPSDSADQASFKIDKTTYKLKVGSCIDYVLAACEMGHEKTLLSIDWNLIKSCLVEKRGMSLAKGLENAGWMGVYFNPDVYHPRDKLIDKHYFTYNPVAKKWRRYQAYDSINKIEYKFGVSQLVINYAPTTVYDDGTIEPKVTPQETGKLNKLKQVPFGVVNVSGGTHTALFSNGYIYEIHWDKSYKDPSLYEKIPLENWGWLSGAIQIPHGTWPS